ncbi:MAG: hypothetical protein WD178_06915 [Actinomycetota bacterium]
MPKTIQIRDLDDDVYRQLQRRAAETGISVPELLRKEAARLVSRPSLAEWMERTSRRSWDATNREVVEALDEIRGPWPDAGS